MFVTLPGRMLLITFYDNESCSSVIRHEVQLFHVICNTRIGIHVICIKCGVHLLANHIIGLYHFYYNPQIVYERGYDKEYNV